MKIHVVAVFVAMAVVSMAFAAPLDTTDKSTNNPIESTTSERPIPTDDSVTSSDVHRTDPTGKPDHSHPPKEQGRGGETSEEESSEESQENRRDRDREDGPVRKHGREHFRKEGSKKSSEEEEDDEFDKEESKKGGRQGKSKESSEEDIETDRRSSRKSNGRPKQGRKMGRSKRDTEEMNTTERPDNDVTRDLTGTSLSDTTDMRDYTTKPTRSVSHPPREDTTRDSAQREDDHTKKGRRWKGKKPGKKGGRHGNSQEDIENSSEENSSEEKPSSEENKRKERRNKSGKRKSRQ